MVAEAGFEPHDLRVIASGAAPVAWSPHRADKSDPRGSLLCGGRFAENTPAGCFRLAYPTSYARRPHNPEP